MKFGEVLVGEAEGAILAHSVKHGGGVLKKGRVLSAADINTLTQSGVSSVLAARLDPGDVVEDEAASIIATAIAGPGVSVQQAFTGRANLHAMQAGVAVVDDARVRALNRLHESLTLATVPAFETVEDRQMVATVKIIPFAVPRDVVGRAQEIIGGQSLVEVAGFKARTAGLVITRLPQTKPAVIEKSEEAIRERLEAMEGRLGQVIVCDHTIGAVQAAIGSLKESGHNPVLVFGASAIVDRGDVIPAAVAAAGGTVIHLGMPVDPGNLLMLGELGQVPVIGVPSCARSPKVNGFDWVLARLMAGLNVSARDIMDMGPGGLLMEIPTRPSPRERKGKVQKAPQIAAVVLAAGQSRRMGRNKLVADFDGMAMIRHAVVAVLEAKADPVIIVTGHEPEAVMKVLDGFPVQFVHNSNYASGLSSSLKTGLRSVPDTADGAVVCLGDMPLIQSWHINKLVAAFNPIEHRSICVPISGGERGNPVLWGKQHFALMANLTGDKGARELMNQLADEVVEVPMASNAVLTDFDTPEALNDAREKTADGK